MSDYKNKKPGSDGYEPGKTTDEAEEFEVVDIEIDDDDDEITAEEAITTDSAGKTLEETLDETGAENADESDEEETAVKEFSEENPDADDAAAEKNVSEGEKTERIVPEEAVVTETESKETESKETAAEEVAETVSIIEEGSEKEAVEKETSEETIETSEEITETSEKKSEADKKAAEKEAKAAAKAAAKEEKKKNKSKMPRWAKIVIGICIGLLVIALGVFIGVKIYLSRIPRIQEREKLDPSSETFETSSGLEDATDSIDPDEVNWDSLYQEIKADSDVKNILLIGQDGRPGDASNTRSDSMILCSINKKTNNITLVSFMRDMYVPIPGYSDNRINASYSFGGAALLKETIEADFGISIDNCMEVNFDGFIRAMSAVGDLEIELTEAEAKYLNEMGNAMNKEEGLPEAEWNLKEGKNILRPDQALAYSRTRYVGRSDYERTERQRKVLTAAFNKVARLSTSEQVDLANAIIPYIATDMTDMEILGYVYYVATDGVHVGNSYRVPADKTYTNETIRSMMVLVPSLSQNSELLKEWLYQGVN